MTELVHYRVERAIAMIILDSPTNRNALSEQLVGELLGHLQTATTDGDVRAAVLTHTGNTFCAGADLSEFRTPDGPARGTRRMRELLRAIVEVPKPVIARLDGHARAGGLGVIGACDIAIAGPASTFAFTEVRLGLAPAIISLTTLGPMSGRTAARYYLTGETFDAQTAADGGLITIAPADADAALSELCDALRACSPQGLAETKRLTARSTLAELAERGEQAQSLSARLFASDEAREGMLAFLEKRRPAWDRPGR